MIIEWKITKKRGYFRPVLHYSVRLEDHEKALALPIVSIVSDIPQPEEDRQDYCYPGLFERAAGYTPAHFYTLEAPRTKGIRGRAPSPCPGARITATQKLSSLFNACAMPWRRKLNRPTTASP